MDEDVHVRVRTVRADKARLNAALQRVAEVGAQSTEAVVVVAVAVLVPRVEFGAGPAASHPASPYVADAAKRTTTTPTRGGPRVCAGTRRRASVGHV